MALISKRLCRLKRGLLGVSQAELSRAAGLNLNYICRFENGAIASPSASKMHAINRAFEALEAERLERRAKIEAEIESTN